MRCINEMWFWQPEQTNCSIIKFVMMLCQYSKSMSKHRVALDYCTFQVFFLILISCWFIKLKLVLSGTGRACCKRTNYECTVSKTMREDVCGNLKLRMKLSKHKGCYDFLAWCQGLILCPCNISKFQSWVLQVCDVGYFLWCLQTLALTYGMI